MWRGLVSLVLLGGAVACQSAAAEEPVGSAEQHAVVTQAQAERAYAITSSLDYLPWGYSADGCYARALYMSMELAVERIPSSSQYIYGTDGAMLRPDIGAVWSWHVAPMIKVSATGTPMIIDPSLFAAPQAAHSLDEWVARNNPVPATDHALALFEGSKYRQLQEGNPVSDAEPISSFEELDPFQPADIDSACEMARSYLARESPRPAEAELVAKRARLIARTRELITGLTNVGKLSGMTADTLRCGGHADGTAPVPATSEEEVLPIGNDGSGELDPIAQ